MAKRTRAPNLTDAHIAAVVEIIDGWTGELTWRALIDRTEIVLHARYTRQSLAKHARIQQAFSNYTEREEQKSGRRPEFELLKGQIARLEAENTRLERENNNLLEQFARWAFHASQRGLDQNFLNRPLPKIDRA